MPADSREPGFRTGRGAARELDLRDAAGRHRGAQHAQHGVHCHINSRLADLFIARGADPANISGYVTRVTDIVERWLDVAT